MPILVASSPPWVLIAEVKLVGPAGEFTGLPRASRRVEELLELRGDISEAGGRTET